MVIVSRSAHCFGFDVRDYDVGIKFKIFLTIEAGSLSALEHLVFAAVEFGL